MGVFKKWDNEGQGSCHGGQWKTVYGFADKLREMFGFSHAVQVQNESQDWEALFNPDESWEDAITRGIELA